jgi:hypothetical protein
MNTETAFPGITIAALPPGGYNPDDTRENLLEYFGVALAFILSVLVIWMIIRKDLKRK